LIDFVTVNDEVTGGVIFLITGFIILIFKNKIYKLFTFGHTTTLLYKVFGDENTKNIFLYWNFIFWNYNFNKRFFILIKYF